MSKRFSILAFVAAGFLTAHPMGNFSVSHYAKLQVSPQGVDVEYVLDLAEIPTFELLRDWKLDAHSPRPELSRRASEQARVWTKHLDFTAGGHRLTPHFESATLVIADGAGGLPIARISTRLHLPAAPGRLEYDDHNYPDRAGWKEIVIAAESGATIKTASQDNIDRSHALTVYPADPTLAPPQDLRAAINWIGGATSVRPLLATAAPVIARVAQPKAPAAAAAPSAPASAANAPKAAAGTVVRGDFLSKLLGQRDLSIATILFGLLVAFALGAMHALSPGHGKTIVAAYLVGSRGTVGHALFLGGMVTFTHTISVFALGLATLFLSEYLVPERIFPVLGAISGLSIVVIGASLLYKRARIMRAHSHPPHVHTHDHHDHAHGHHHDHGPHSHTHVPEGDITLGSLIALGASGGLVPCPSALVLLLSAIALGRVGLGLTLLVAFSLGLAVVLMAIGVVVLYAKHLLPDTDKAARHPAFRLLPVLSAAVIVCLGLLMTGVSLGWVQPNRFIG
ncbi:MAG: hypothetical protein ABI165_07475 [Bryobacteraceae bacterium]